MNMQHMQMNEDVREQIQSLSNAVVARRLIARSIEDALDEIVYAFATCSHVEGTANEVAEELIALFLARLNTNEIAKDLAAHWREMNEDNEINEDDTGG